MNCTEFIEWMGPYLSGEIEASRRTEFDSHVAACLSCRQVLEGTVSSDARVRHALLSEQIDPSSPLSGARNSIARRRLQGWMGIAAALLLTFAATGFWMQSRLRPTGLLASVARDHRAEVTQNKPRRWRMALAEVRPLLEEYGVAWSDVETLLPVGFVLEKAKQCGIDGNPTLHLVFNDGRRLMSVYVQKPGTPPGSGQAVMNGAEIATFRRGHISGIVIATAPGLCAEAVRRLTAM